ncbi:hypothetical protein PROFUN_15679 [Planoprotostelium fungivorum]|uniref:Uncharacterized protein n=1 Tax=Planoprotostelium fungivorum TaxID=1890364 RepID=A0A2P6MV23_9EUKA|nr:hypothetical protein PROFUN_15679 [Planoprotostelium fungivorum]
MIRRIIPTFNATTVRPTSLRPIVGARPVQPKRGLSDRLDEMKQKENLEARAHDEKLLAKLREAHQDKTKHEESTKAKADLHKSQEAKLKEIKDAEARVAELKKQHKDIAEELEKLN